MPVYKNTAQNRKLGRVGKHWGKKPPPLPPAKKGSMRYKKEQAEPKRLYQLWTTPQRGRVTDAVAQLKKEGWEKHHTTTHRGILEVYFRKYGTASEMRKNYGGIPNLVGAQHRTPFRPDYPHTLSRTVVSRGLLRKKN